MTTPKESKTERDRREAEKLLRQKGFTREGETLLAGTRRLLNLCQKQGVALERNSDILEALATEATTATNPQGPDSVGESGECPSYFVSYTYSYTEYENGGDDFVGHGNTCLKIPSGVTSWETIAAMQMHIAKELAAQGVNNPKPVIMFYNLIRE